MKRMAGKNGRIKNSKKHLRWGDLCDTDYASAQLIYQSVKVMSGELRMTTMGVIRAQLNAYDNNRLIVKEP